MITMSRASCERIVEILDEEPDIESPANPVTQVKDGSVDFENVSFSYSKDPDKCCLENINLHIPSGAVVGVLGGTGSSKSSLVQLIPRLYDATLGSVKVGGVDVKDYDLDGPARQRGHGAAEKRAVCRHHLPEPALGQRAGHRRRGAPRVRSWPARTNSCGSSPTGYDTFIEQGGTNVSGGQKQRLCIARALLKKPKILILDDSTSAVDTRTDARIRKAFQEEIPGTTKIVIAQRVASVEDADMIIVLDGGKVNGCGTHAELLANNEIYREVYESQQKGGQSDDE